MISLTKTAKIFWVTLDVAMHGAAYVRQIHHSHVKIRERKS